MPLPTVSHRISATHDAMAPFLEFFARSPWSARRTEPTACDFVFGNPDEPPLPEFVQALERHVAPRDVAWFAYKIDEPGPRRIVARSLRGSHGMPFEEEDVFLTNGAFAALSVSLAALTDPGDEVIFVTPPWFFYEAMIVACGAVPVRVAVDLDTFDLDVAALARAITPRTRAVIVNSPHNPTGKIFPSETLAALADVLSEAGRRHGRTIYLLSDEAYSRIVFDGRTYPSPTSHYPDSLLLYTYGKTLLTPGQRLGYIALPPTMADREPLRRALFAAQMVTGLAVPNALMQHALADLDVLTIDIGALQRKRDRLVSALRGMGYRLQVPEGTFYLLVHAPVPDDVAFAGRLAEHDVFVLPGSVVEMPGTFRVSLTGSEAAIERSLRGFEQALAAETPQRA
jgi:aspartate aminotransferase